MLMPELLGLLHRGPQKPRGGLPPFSCQVPRKSISQSVSQRPQLKIPALTYIESRSDVEGVVLVVPARTVCRCTTVDDGEGIGCK